MAAALLSLFGAYLPSSSSSSTSAKATSAAQQGLAPGRGSASEQEAQVLLQDSQSQPQPQPRQHQYQTQLLQPFARDASGMSTPADPGGSLLSPALSTLSAATNSPYPPPSTGQVDDTHAALHYLDPADDATSKSGYLQAGTSPALTNSLSESVPRNANRPLDLYPGYSTDDEERDVLTGDLPRKPSPAPMAPPSAESGSLGSSDLREQRQEHIYQRAVRREDRRRSSVKVGHAKPSKKYSARAISFKSRPGTTAAILNALRRGQAAQDGVFNERARSHIRALVRALLVERGIPTRVWEKVLLELSIKAAEAVAPNVREGDSCDVGRYVKIKKIPGGLPQDSEYVDGLVFTKNVAHKSMQKDVAFPRIVVVDFCLEYQREDELSSLENLAHHREYIHALCTKVLAYRPSVVICGRHVSGIALEVFVKAGVVVVSRVKTQLLSSISRFTGAEIIQSVEELTPERQVGFCGSFKGCVKEVGCSLVIRGGDMDLLDAIKSVVAFGVFAAYNLRLEASLMKDELATPTTDHESSRLSQLLLGAEEPIVPENKIVACSEVMTDLAKKAGAEKKHLLHNLHQTLVNTPATDMLALNSIIRALQEKTVAWEALFTGVIRNFIQFDMRFSTLPLRGIFQDRANSTMVNDTLTGRMAVIEPDSFSPELVVLGSSPTRPSLLLDEFEEYSTPRITEGEHAHKLRPLLLEDNEASLGAKGVACLHFDGHCNAHDYHAVIGEEEPMHDIWHADPVHTGAIPVPAVEILGTETDPLEYREPSGRTPPHAWRVTIETSADGDEVEAVLGSERNHITGVCSGDEVVPVGSLGSSAMATARQISGRITGAGERSSIMKTISSLWSGNPGNLLPLENPILPTEHIFQDSLVIVREDEPSSIIAFTLSSSHYKEKLQSMQAPPTSGPVDRDVKGGGGDDFFGLEKLANPDDLPPPTPAPPLLGNGEIEETLLKGTGNHIKFQFWDGPTRLDCKAYYAEQFDALRRNCGFNEIYIHSLARCFRWEASGGKSRSAFMKTTDDRLILKQLSKPEMDALLKFAPSYFTYVSEAFFHKLPTVLAKIFGVYRIGFKNPVTNRSLKIDVLVMENLFYERTISRIFDLKGSTRNRHVQSTGKQNEVLLDENLVEYIGESPLFIRDHSKRLLRASVWNDTLFLFKLNVMDYSLVVGIDEEKRELVVGIVDFIRTFTWDKKLESWVKETAFLSGGREPTIISPRQYKNRFRESMERYFLSPPTCFTLSPPPAPWTPPGKLPDELQD
ncbi:1-phosphatidylinositol-3-phosphate 5-kinase [Cladochytrium tenue]|nr:1-phosphatidylinositol-3-phosphate 5-kinase [Cladochytrium tenue]